VRTVVLPGLTAWEEVDVEADGEVDGACNMLAVGPVKVVLDEATTDVEGVARAVSAARAAGHAVAIHAVSEAEVAIALELLGREDAGARAAPDRIEHAATVPEAWLPRLARQGVHVVGQPGLVPERGDHYRAGHPSGQHGWLHRSRSFLTAGIPYAISSDAPVTTPAPGHRLWAAQQRRTRDGHVLGPGERLDALQALRAATLSPAASIGRAHELGRLATGSIADLAILDPSALAGPPGDCLAGARATIADGRLAWAREDTEVA
jgi:predicted amidohydrolase YtcJ